MAEIVEIPSHFIRAGDNDRTQFDDAGLQELASSIAKNGLLQPITVRPVQGDRHKYEIVAGERRFRAMSQVLHAKTIPCIVQNLSDEEASEVMLAENVSRKDLDPVDEANAYQKRAERFGWSPSEIAKRAGVSPDRVRKRLKLMAVRSDILFLVRKGQIPLGHVEAISILDSNRQMIAVKPILNGEQIPLRTFQAFVDKLYAEQAQEALFSIEDHPGNIDPYSTTTEEVYYPVADDLPPVNIPEEHHTGAIIYQYIQDLKSRGFDREAEAVGTLLHYLNKSNYARLPVKINRKKP